MFNSPTAERRSTARSSMVKAAQVASGNALFECVVLNMSATGARLHFLAPAELSEVVFLRLQDGTSRLLQRRWQRGTEVGFEFMTDRRRFIRPVA